MPRNNLKVVKLLNPNMCLDCRFAQMAEVTMTDGRNQRMIHCSRLDCDNWDYSTAEEASEVRVEDEAA